MPVPIDFEALISDSPNAYVLLDRDLRLAWMNDAYLRATMRRREDLLGREMFDAFPSPPESESRRLLERSFRRVLDTGQADELALIRYDIHDPEGRLDKRYWSATHTPQLGEDGAVKYILQHTVDVTELHGLRRLRDEMGLVQRASAVQARNLDLSEETEQLRALFAQAPGFVAMLGGPNHEFRLANPAYRELVGQRDLLGKPLAQALPEVVAQGFTARLDEVRASGRPYVGSAEKVVLENAGLGRGEERFLDFVYQPIFSEQGEVTGILVQGHDVTEQVMAREQQELLIHELNHRVKNSLAVVQSLAAQSFREVPGSEKAHGTFDARLNALAAAHTLLTARNWKAAHLRDTMHSAIEATMGADAARVRMEGPDIELGPQTALSTAMLIHELSTNAIKYGALSRPEGRIAVTWTLAEKAGHCRLEVDWRESGGPPVAPPPRRGFGTRLISRGLATGIGGEVNLDFKPEGLHCTIVALLPLEITA